MRHPNDVKGAIDLCVGRFFRLKASVKKILKKFGKPLDKLKIRVYNTAHERQRRRWELLPVGFYAFYVHPYITGQRRSGSTDYFCAPEPRCPVIFYLLKIFNYHL